MARASDSISLVKEFFHNDFRACKFTKFNQLPSVNK